MRRTKHDRQQRQETAPTTLADLSQAIEQRRLRYTRQGDEYVLRQKDVRAMRSVRARHDYPLGAAQQGALPDKGSLRETLEVGRSA